MGKNPKIDILKSHKYDIPWVSMFVITLISTTILSVNTVHFHNYNKEMKYFRNLLDTVSTDKYFSEHDEENISQIIKWNGLGIRK